MWLLLKRYWTKNNRASSSSKCDQPINSGINSFQAHHVLDFHLQHVLKLCLCISNAHGWEMANFPFSTTQTTLTSASTDTMLLSHTEWSLLSEHCKSHGCFCTGEVLTPEWQISKSSICSQTKARLWGIYGDLTFPELLKRSSIFTTLIDCVCLGWQGRLQSSSFPFTLFCTSKS